MATFLPFRNQFPKQYQSMLDHLAAIASSLKYGPVLEVRPHSILILNQYLFIWNILPQFTGTSISKHRFIREMSRIGFQRIDEQEQMQECDRITPKTIEFRGPSLCLKKLEELQGIREQRKQQIELLRQKVNQIKAGLKVNQIETRKQHGYFQVLDAVSFLKSINRNTYALNQREEQIKFSYKMDYQRLKEDNKEDFIPTYPRYGLKKGKKAKTVRFYSSTQIQQL